MNESKLRERLLDLASEAPKGFEMPPKLTRRARRRVAFTMALSVLTIATLVAGGILGARALGSGGKQPVVQPTETPTSAAAPLPTEGTLLQAGTYVFSHPAAPLNITFTVPNGWRAFGIGALRRSSDSPRHMGLIFSLVHSIYVDPCHDGRGVLVVGPTVDDLAIALANQPRRHGTEPTGVTFDGYAGEYVELTVPIHINFAECDGHTFGSWIGPFGGEREQQGPGQHDELWILDVDGVRLVIDATFMPKTSAHDRSELNKILASVHIDRVTGGAP